MKRLIALAMAAGLVQSLYAADKPMTDRPITVAAYYFGNYHPNDLRNAKWKGKDWSEWDLVKAAKPQFPGHEQPKIPLWGYQDESDPKVMAQKIDAAADHGIDAFIFDWYYYDDGPYLERTLDTGFLKAPNNHRLKFALMWANHDWLDMHPLRHDVKPPLLFPGKVTPDNFSRIGDHIIKDYFLHPSYWRIEGKPYFSFYDLTNLLANFGTVEATRSALDRFRAQAAAAGLPGLHLNAVVWGQPILPAEKTPADVEKLVRELGFDSVTSYVWIHHVTLPTQQTDYDQARDEYFAYWDKARRMFDVPYIPNVTMGWDGTPRAYQEMGFGNTLSGNTPARFREALQRTKERLLADKSGPRILNINCWNEWTEGSYLEPDTRHGMQYLEAVRDVFGPVSRPRSSASTPETPQSVALEKSALMAGLSPREIAVRLAATLLKAHGAPSGDSVAMHPGTFYGIDIPLSALPALYDVTRAAQYLDPIRKALRVRKFAPRYSIHSYETQIFGSLPFELIARGQGAQYIEPFIAESRRYKANVLRAYDGAVSYYFDEFATISSKAGTLRLDPKTTPVLIDHAQEYASRMAKTGWLTAEPAFYAEAAAQIQILRKALRDPETGLWAHGRGWYGPADSLVKTKWGRAHGWLLRGLVETLTYLPQGSPEARQVAEVLQEVAAALLKYQDADGFWHQVIDRPDSFQETSATAFISYDLARAVKQGLLPDEPYRAASIKAFEAVTKWKVSADGAVYGGSATFPPLASTEEYVSWETPINDPHAVAAVIFSAVGRVLLEP